MKLSELLNIPASHLQSDPEINGIQLDSRQVKKGDLFFALPGACDNGSKYIEQAIVNGAAAVAVDAEAFANTSSQQDTYESFIPVIPITHLKENLGLIAARFLNYPANEMIIVGITGTNGKTSTCYLIAEALERLGKKVAIIGTLGCGQLNHLRSTGMTTPDMINLQKILAQFRGEGVQYVIMEVSSHSLDQYRVAGIPFKIAIFSNLTRDHLDYHQTMEHYAATKRKLFNWPSLRASIINADDEYGYLWLSDHFSKQAQLNGEVIAYGASTRLKDFPLAYQISDLQIAANGTSFTLAGNEKIQIKSNLLGRFNAYNLTAVILALHALQVSWVNIEKTIPLLQGVPGRMQVLRIAKKPTIVVDFAHTPDALEQVLKSIRELGARKVICVFGCGGDRDKGKRPLMAEISERLADQIIVTSDNPRTEEPLSIINEICGGFHERNYLVEVDRAQAIKKAIAEAQEGDIVLLAGKGHETYQIVGKEILPFDDVLIAKKYLIERS